MSFGGWGSNNTNPPLGNSTTPSGGMMASSFAGWGTSNVATRFGGGAISVQQQQDEVKFNSLFPVGGFVTGEQVKGIFQASGLPSAKLAQIWNSVDQDRDGKINKQQFCSAMAMIRLAQEQSLPSASLPPSYTSLSTSGVRGDFSAPPPPTATATDSSSGGLSKSWSVTGLAGISSGSLGQGINQGSLVGGQSSQGNGNGQGWSMKPQDRGRYIMEFSSVDPSNSGYITGAVARGILTKSGLNQSVLAKIWELSDIDKDGRLSMEEYCIAMHLMMLVRTRGVTLPMTLPEELRPSVTSSTKYHTIDRATAKKAAAESFKTPEKPGSVSMVGSQSPVTSGHARTPSGGRSPMVGGGHTRNTSLGRIKDGAAEEGATFEDKRKENFEAGRLELQRRRRAIKEQQEKEQAEKERKRREEEERRLQQEHEAELARQAELERQRRKAMEIEKEREEQMKKLAKKREEEEKELELKRKAEWARKRRVELEGQRDWEKKHLYGLRVQHSQLEDELRQLDQKKLGVLASIERQKGSQTQMSMSLRSMRVSHDIRRAEITKLQTELNTYHSQLSALQKQRRELRDAMLDRSPEMSIYQQQRQELKDRIMSLSASLAGMRSNISHSSKTSQELRENIANNSKLLMELKESCHKDEAKAESLRHHVLSRQQAAEEAQREEARRRQEEEEAARKEEKARREREEAARRERDKVAREEENLRRERRREQIRKDHEAIIKKTRQEKAMASTAVTASSPISSVKSTAPISPKHQSKPANQSKSKATPSEHGNWEVEDDQVRKKVLELQKKKEELQQKQRELNKGSPTKPAPYKGKQDASKQKGKKDKKKESPVQSTQVQQQLLDLNSSWDSSAQDAIPVSNLPTDMSQVLLPLTETTENNEEDGTAAEEEKRTTAAQEDFKPSQEDSPAPSDGSGVRKFSVSRLSELFDKGLVSQQGSGWSSHVAEVKPGRIKSPLLEQQTDTDQTNLDYVNTNEFKQPSAVISGDQAEDYVNLDTVPTLPAAMSADSDLTSDRPSLVTCQVLYTYQAQDDTEVSITEGDLVTIVPQTDASPGWSMVRLADNSQGWVPQSYLDIPIDESQSDYGQVPRDGGTETSSVGNTGQAGSPVHQSSPSGKDSPGVFVPAQVLFNWKGTKDNHLSLVKGEQVQVLKQGEKWWSGQSNGKIGWFPKTFVKLLEAPSQTPPPVSPLPSASAGDNQGNATSTAAGNEDTLYEAIYEFVGTADGDLTFYVGDIIKVTSKGGEWWTGELDGRSGTFPSTYVIPRSSANNSRQENIYDTPAGETPSGDPIYDTPIGEETTNNMVANPVEFSSQVSSQSSVSNVSTSLAPSTASEAQPNRPLIGRVNVSFSSTKPGQLNLDYGELVKVFKQSPNGWWEGEVQSRGKKRAVGWFPANRVELLPQRQSRNSSVSSTSSVPSTPASVMGVGMRRLSRARSPLLEALEDTNKPGGVTTANLVLALYTYTAQSSDELSFHKGSVISVLDKEGGEWWKGEVNDKVGLFPSNYVQPLTEQQLPAGEITRWADSVSDAVLQSVTDKERKRQEAIFELLTSERHYVDSLKLVKEVFFDPMAEQQVLTEEEMAKVMVNWDDLIKCSNDMLSAFLVRLRTSGEMVRGIGDVLVSQIPHLTPHIRWCSCQLTACTILQQKAADPRFKDFEQKCTTDSRTGGLPLSSFLLKPMQRVTKYPLLIRRIVEYTAVLDPDMEQLQQALKKAETLCEHVNDGVHQKDNTEKLEWLQSHVQFVNLDENIVFNSQTNFMGPRKLLHWGKFFKIRGSKDLVGFLFNDFLLLVRPKSFFALSAPGGLEPWGKNDFLLYRKPFLLETLKPKKSGSDANGSLLTLTTLSTEEKDILLRVESDSSRDLWAKKIAKASLDYLTTKKRIEREKKEKFMRTMRDSVGTLDVTVVEGLDLLAKDPNNKSDPFCVVKFGDQQEQTTPVINNNLNPKWNYKMQFAVSDINRDALEISVFDKDLFSPNDFLGSGRVTLKDLLRDKDSPWDKTLLLESVSNGEITLKIALTLKKDNLLL